MRTATASTARRSGTGSGPAEAVVRVLVLNVGSASLKAARFVVEDGAAQPRWRGSLLREPGTPVAETAATLLADPGALGDGVDAIGHRVVHGGRRFVEPVCLDADVRAALAALGALAPLHNPPALEAIDALTARLPDLPAVAVFDTAFHARRPPEARLYPLPATVREAFGLDAFGFHGLAHEALTRAVADAEGVEVDAVDAVTLQLGSGCSGCAVRAGRSVETSMGFSPLGGLPMATRSGDLDPGVVLALLREGHDAASLETLLSRESGLLGLGGSGDVRELLAREAAGDEAAATALALFVRRIVLLAGAYFTLLEGRGALVFGGGIGTHSAELRARICAGLGSWNVRLDPARNAAGAPGRLSEDGARPVHVFETEEESLVARRTAATLAGGA